MTQKRRNITLRFSVAELMGAKKKWERIVIIILLIVIRPISAGAEEEIELGVATSLTLLEGKESLKAVELAVEEINNKGGVRQSGRKIPIKIQSIDLREGAREVPVSKALFDLEKFIREKKVHAIVVGPFRSEVLLASMDLIAEYRVPLLGTIAMSAASEARIIRDPKYHYIFRVGLNSKYLVEYIINAMKFLKDKFGFNRVYIMNQDSAWARGTTSLLIKLFFEREGWEVLGLDTYSYGDKEFSTGLKKAREKGAQVILPIFDMPQSGILVRQWNIMKVPALICGFISPMAGPGAWSAFEGKIAGALNVIFELGNVPSSRFTPAGNFYNAYRRRYGREIESGHGPAPAYESVYILADAIERARSLDPEKIVTALEKTDRIGAMGRIKFHKGHQVIFGKDPHEEAVACIVQWTKKGNRKIVYPPAIAEGKIELPDFLK